MSTESGQPEADRQTCSPCRGTGRVISNLGGEQREVTCPWCGGSGQFAAGRDAQEATGGSPPPEGDETPPGRETGQ